MSIAEIKQMIEDQGKSWSEFKTRYEGRMDIVEKELGELATKAGRAAISGLFGGAPRGQAPEQQKSLEQGIRALISGNQAKAEQHFAEYKAMSAGSDPGGGYLVTPQFSTEMTKVMQDISPITSLARTIELTQGDSFEEIVDADDAEANWVGETQPRNDSEPPELKKFVVELNELCAYPKVTQKLIDTASIDVVTWLRDKVGESFAAKESNAYHLGNGVGKPRGFLTYPVAATPDATRAWGTIEFVKTGASGAFATATASVNPADVLIDVVSSMRAQYRAGARWLMSRTTAGVVRKLKDADGRHIWVDSLVEGQPALLLGYPVDISEDMPGIEADSLSIAFANWRRAYTIIRKLGVRFLVDPYSAPPYVKLHSYERVGGGVNNSEAIKLVKFSA
jgi:HK97 family phage major capsid protein